MVGFFLFLLTSMSGRKFYIGTKPPTMKTTHQWLLSVQEKMQSAGPEFQQWKMLDEFDLCMLLDGYSPLELLDLRKLYF